MGSFHATIRDFSKSREGHQYLETLFNYNAFPNPNQSPISNDFGITKDLLGRSFEYILQLVVERQNFDFEFEDSFKEGFGDARTKKAKEVKRYFESGELSDNLLSLMISLAQERQKSFQFVRSRSKQVVQEGLKDELRRLHRLASNIKWGIKNSFYSGWLTDGRMATAEADLIIDATLIEVKSVKDTSKHSEHLSQLFSYFLLSQAPMRKGGPFVIDELGLYYARHGKLVKQNVSTLVRFPLNCVRRVAFDFVVEFSRWRLRGFYDDNHALFEVLKELYPRPEWFAKILEKRQAKSLKEFKKGCFTKTPRIVLPKDFLV